MTPDREPIDILVVDKTDSGKAYCLARTLAEQAFRRFGLKLVTDSAGMRVNEDISRGSHTHFYNIDRALGGDSRVRQRIPQQVTTELIDRSRTAFCVYGNDFRFVGGLDLRQEEHTDLEGKAFPEKVFNLSEFAPIPEGSLRNPDEFIGYSRLPLGGLIRRWLLKMPGGRREGFRIGSNYNLPATIHLAAAKKTVQRSRRAASVILDVMVQKGMLNIQNQP